MNSKNSKNIFLFILFLGILDIIFYFLLDPYLLSKFSKNGELHNYYVQNITESRFVLLALGIFLFFIGYLGGKFKLLSFIDCRDKLTNWLMLSLIFIWGLIQVEALLRIKPILSKNEQLRISVGYEPAIFARHRLVQENKDTYFINDSISGIIRNGYLGEDFSLKKPDEEIRIFILGGSFIFGEHEPTTWELMDESYRSNWVAKAQKSLRKKGYKNVRLINAGIPGHASFDSFGRLYSEIHLYDPDYVILCHGWNDIKYFNYLSLENSLLRMFNPLPEFANKKNTGFIASLEKSQIYLRLKEVFSGTSRGVEGVDFEREASDYSNPLGIKQFKVNLQLFVDASKNIGATPILMTQPRLVSPTNTAEEKNKIGYGYIGLTHQGLCDVYQEIDATMQQVSVEKGAKFFDLAKDYIGKSGLFNDHVHLNRKGGDAISEELSQFIDVQLLKELKDE